MYSTHQTSYYPMDFFIPMETIDPSTVMESSSYQNVISHVHPLQISYRQEEFTLSPLLKENSIDFIGFQSENIFDSNFSESTENYSPLLSPVISPLEDIFGVSNQDLIYEQVEEEIEEDDEENDPDWSRPNLTSKKRKTVDIQDNIQCTNCGTTKTPLWRRNPEGLSLCNACGLFLKLHGVVRPLSLKTDVIKKRNRNHGNQKTRRNVKKKKSLKRTKKTNSTRR